jgi:hypothetical protein
VTVHFGAGTAEMNVQNLALQDRFTKPNALGPNWATNFDPATVSFDVVWSGPITRSLSFTDSTDVDQFTGSYNQNQVTVTWSGTNLNSGFSFTANPGTLATSSVNGGFAELGQEQNGSFVSNSSAARVSAKADAVLVQALTASQVIPASTGTALVVPTQRAIGPSAIATGSSQVIQGAPGAVQPAGGAVDAVFAASPTATHDDAAGLFAPLASGSPDAA